MCGWSPSACSCPLGPQGTGWGLPQSAPGTDGPTQASQSVPMGPGEAAVQSHCGQNEVQSGLLGWWVLFRRRWQASLAQACPRDPDKRTPPHPYFLRSSRCVSAVPTLGCLALQVTLSGLNWTLPAPPNSSRPRLTYRAGLSLLGSSRLLFFPEPVPAKLRLGEGTEQVHGVPATASSGRPVPTHLRACCPRCP